MTRNFTPMIAATGGLALFAAPVAAAQGPTDPEIAHIAYVAGSIDIAAAKLALDRSTNTAVREFASAMLRDHEAVNNQALALAKKLNVTPAANGTSASLQEQADKVALRLSQLSGSAFDRAYAENEVTYHRTVNGALASTLIPSADNADLKALLTTGLALFREHQAHAEHLAAQVK